MPRRQPDGVWELDAGVKDHLPHVVVGDFYVRAAERGRTGWAYAIRDTETRLVKIGVSRNPKRRLRDLARVASGHLELLWTQEGGMSLEAFLHRHFAKRNVRGEWFDFSDADPVELISQAVAQRKERRGND